MRLEDPLPFYSKSTINLFFEKNLYIKYNLLLSMIIFLNKKTKDFFRLITGMKRKVFIKRFKVQLCGAVVGSL